MQRQNTFRELRNFLSGIRGDQYVISREQDSKDPLGPQMWWVGRESSFSPILFHWASQNYTFCLFHLILYVPANDFSIVFGWVFWVDQY